MLGHLCLSRSSLSLQLIFCAYCIPSRTCRVVSHFAQCLSALIATFLCLVAICCALRGTYLRLSQPIWWPRWSFTFILGWLLPCSSLSSHATQSHPSLLSCPGCCS